MYWGEKENKKNKILNYLFIYYVYIFGWVVKLLGVAELGVALVTEMMEAVLVSFGKSFPWSIGDSWSSMAGSSM